MQKLLILLMLMAGNIPACTADSDLETTKPAAVRSDLNNDLDILQDYDRDIWPGPAKWSEEQWHWKQLLRWDKECDYIADIKAFNVTATLEIVTIMCVPGAYQPMYYVYLFNKADNNSMLLEIGAPENTDIPKNVNGNIFFNNQQKQLTILSLSRGIGDCGTYQIYQFDGTFTKPALIEKRHKDCSENPLPENPPPELFDPKQWPKVY